MAKIRSMFAGSNSGLGFHSFFDQIIGEEARLLFLLKGGPGTGKSRFMKEVAQAVGDEQELFFCSSDSHSLDAVAFPKLGVALMDATAPHERDAEWAGCRDELIYLGSFWSQAGLAKRREEIIAQGLLKRQFFAHAFRYLQAARLMEENIGERNKKIKNSYFAGAEVLKILEANRTEGRGRARHLFASAITPEGYVSHIACLATGYSEKFILRGLPGTGKSEYLKDLVRQACYFGFSPEVFYYPLNPHKILHVLVPELKLAILTAIMWDPLDELQGPRIDFGGDVDFQGEDFRFLQEFFNRAVKSLQDAQKVHLKLEQHYASNMDFEALDVYRDEIIKKILVYKNRSS